MSDPQDELPHEEMDAVEDESVNESEPQSPQEEPDLSWLMVRPQSAQQEALPGAIEDEERNETGDPEPTSEAPSNVLPLQPARRREPERRPVVAEPVRTERPRAEPPTSERPRPTHAETEARRRPADEDPEEEPETLRQVAAQAAARAGRAERRDYRAVVQAVQRHLSSGYSLLGLVGYSASGKTHFLRALSLLLRRQGFEVAAWETLRKARVPVATEVSVFHYPCTGPRGEKWVFVDAGGELYARLRANDWQLPEESAALLHSLNRCRGLFLLLHLQPGHFRTGSLGTHRWISDEETRHDRDAQEAQAELEFFDHVLLFLRALKAEKGKVQDLVVRCAAEPDLDKALRSYRDQAPKLDIPVMVLFSQADTFDDSPLEVAEGSFLSPRVGTVNAAAFAARHLPGLFGSLVQHARRFKFDFVQSYEEMLLPGQFNPDGTPAVLPKWEIGDELLSVGALPALEYLYRNLPSVSRWGRLLQRYELETRHALNIDRWLHRRQWRGVEVP